MRLGACRLPRVLSHHKGHGRIEVTRPEASKLELYSDGTETAPQETWTFAARLSPPKRGRRFIEHAWIDHQKKEEENMFSKPTQATQVEAPHSSSLLGFRKLTL